MQNKRLLYGALAVLVIALASFSYFTGRKSSLQPSPSPTPSPTITDQAAVLTSPGPSPTGGTSPSPSPSPSPTPSPAAFAVTGVVAAVSPATFSGDCPKQFNFSANIAANSAGTVTYKWIRSDGAGAATQSLVFGAAGTKAASDTSWTLGGPGGSYNAWQKVQVLTPNSIESNQASFSLSCST